MRVGVLGTNFKTAKIEMREALSLACHQQLSTFSELGRKYACVLLATCNRVEIYFSAPDLAEAHSDLLHALKEKITIPFEHQLYSYFGGECFAHLSHVTAGLDSAIVAESEIQRQVKTAYERTLLNQQLPSCMHYLFQKSLQIGKYIRSHFALSCNQVTIPKLLFEMGRSSYPDVKKTPVLFVGNSEINRQIISYFKYKGLEHLTLCSRSLYAAKDLADKMKLALLDWEHLSFWPRYSWVVCGSNSPHYVITPSQEPTHTHWIFDLSMPRTVDPEVGARGEICLVNMEQMIDLSQKRQLSNTEVVLEARQSITQRVERYLDHFLSKEVRFKICM